MMDFLFGKKGSNSNSQGTPKPKIILVIDAASKTGTNWAKVFEGCKDKDGIPIRVEQASWPDIMLSAYPNNKTFVDVQPSREPIPGTTMNTFRTIKPDFLLIRNSVTDIKNKNYLNTLYGFEFAGVPSVNSLESIYNCTERPWVFAQLIKIRNRVGEDKFPLIEQNYFSTHQEMQITPQYPIVVKVGNAHAGFGKVKLLNHHDFEDLRSLVALHEDYSTAEPFIEGEYDLRIQKIGNHYRAFRRISVSGNWKTNTGCSMIEDIEMTDRYKLWCDERSKIFGGLDILAVDAIHAPDGKEYILEVNDTSIGLSPDHEEEDNGYIRDLVMEKFRKIYG